MKATGTIIEELRRISGRRHLLTRPRELARYCTGIRFGSGDALAVVRPGSLVELWRVVRVCVARDVIVIVQAANTGLTGGSTPDGEDYDHPVVIIATERLQGIHLIDHGRQVVCLPGATLHSLEGRLAPLGREPHSVIGSSCIGASVIGGICNNSGGALVRRGPAFTELSLYAKLNEDGELQLVNDLGIALGDDPETMLSRLEAGNFQTNDVMHDPDRKASDKDYATHVRQCDSPTPARFNADPRCLSGASGSAGRVIVFAVRLDTFEADPNSRVFYIGTNEPDELSKIRRHILTHFTELPICAEYIHRDAFDMAARFGKDTFLAIRHFGTARLPTLFRWKSKIDSLGAGVGLREGLSDRLLQVISQWMPQHLPRRMTAFRDQFEHHLLLRVSGPGVGEARHYLERFMSSNGGGFFECSPDEAHAAFLHRFAVASAAVRYRTLNRDSTQGIVALDIALPRNTDDWFEKLPGELERLIVRKLYYGHFLCYVFHQDYIIAPDQDLLAIEHQMWRLLDARGAEYPAEHNVGHLYKAKPELEQFYRSLDPLNRFNPGIGQTSRRDNWRHAT